MFSLAAIVLFIGFALIVLFLAKVANAPIVQIDDWVGGLGLAILIAGLVLAAYGFLGWMGWGVPGWLIWLTGIVGVLVLAISWAGTFGDPLARSPIESYPFLVIFGSGILAAAVVAGCAY